MSNNRTSISSLEHAHTARAQGLTIHAYAKKHKLKENAIYGAAHREKIRNQKQQAMDGEAPVLIKKMDRIRLHLGDGYIDLSFEDLRKLLK